MLYLRLYKISGEDCSKNLAVKIGLPRVYMDDPTHNKGIFLKVFYFNENSALFYAVAQHYDWKNAFLSNISKRINGMLQNFEFLCKF